jgi:hypothetical protein
MSHPAQFSGREFLKTSAQTAGALILGFSLPTRTSSGTGLRWTIQGLPAQRMAENYCRQSDHDSCRKTRTWTGLAYIYSDDDRGGIGG